MLLDEVHLLPGWAGHLKAEWDRLRRQHRPVHVVATGSSALRLAAGSRETLAGRFERLTLTHWPASSIAEVFDLPPAEAAALMLRWGSYPGALPLRGDAARWAAYVRDAIIEPAIGRDLLALAPIRRPALLRQVPGAAVAAPAQVVTLQKLQGQLHDRGALETIASSLALVEEAYLVAALPKDAHRALRRRAAPPRLVALNQALPAASDPGGPPEPAREPARFGAWLENACLAHAWNTGQQVAYWREEPLEVDAVLDGPWGRWAVEAKVGPIRAQELRGSWSSSAGSRGIAPSSWATRRPGARRSGRASPRGRGRTSSCGGRRGRPFPARSGAADVPEPASRPGGSASVRDRRARPWGRPPGGVRPARRPSAAEPGAAGGRAGARLVVGEERADHVRQPRPQLVVVRLVDVGDAQDPELRGMGGPARPDVGGVLGLHHADHVGPLDVAGRERTAARIGVDARGPGLVLLPCGHGPGQDAEDLLGDAAPADVPAADEQDLHGGQAPAPEAAGRAGAALSRRSRRKRKNSAPSRSRRRITAGSRSMPPTMETIFRGRK